MNELAGTGSLIRLILRRDLIILPIWILVLAVLPITTASAFQELYPTAAAREAFAATIGANPALTGLLGPLFDSSIGGLTAWRVAFVLLGAGLMSLLTVIRHTRAEEEAGRRELLGSTVVGRHAPLSAALIVTFCANLVLAALVAGGLIGVGLPAPGSVSFGLSIAAVGWIFASIAGVAAQLTEGAGSARGLAGLVLGLSFLSRFAGDVDRGGNLSWMSWMSPLGWGQRVRPFADESWWIFSLLGGVAAVMAVAAYALSSRRDLGSGVLPPRLGPAKASRRLRSPLALAWRLQVRSLTAWSAGFAAAGAVIGGVAQSASDILNQSPQLRGLFEQLGGKSALADAYLFATMGILGLVASAYAIRATLHLRFEEVQMRTEPLLATSIGRLRWANSHLVLAAIGSTIVVSMFGATAGLVYGLAVGDVGRELPRVLLASLAYLPAIWVLAGIAMALFGLLPRFTAWSWGALVLFFLLGQLGELLRLSQSLLDISPFTHVPNVLVGEASAAPLLWLVVVAALFTAAGLVGFRRRDVG